MKESLRLDFAYRIERVGRMQGQEPQLTREQLYERVWTTPLLQLAAEFSISSVALAKRCRKLNIPTPPRGYWVKVEFGKRVRKPPLPSAATVGLSDPRHHSTWPQEIGGLCERARLFLTALEQEKPDYRGLQSLRVPLHPHTAVSKALAARPARRYHALRLTIEPTGIPYRKARGKYQPAYFESEYGKLHLEIEESMVPPRGSLAWQNQREVGTGQLRLILKAQFYGRGWSRSWDENKDGSIRELVTKLTEEVAAYFQEQAQQQAAEKERRRLEHVRWLKSEAERKQRQHEETLIATQRTREQDLFRAAVWSRLYADTLGFLKECEARWTVNGPLTAEQSAWLEWARTTAEAWSPWIGGYPDPTWDGSFDPAAVPFEGPYPVTRKFPRPPNMPEVPQPEHQNSYGMRKESYPFWLRQPR